jgi:hypothetical protein
MEHPAGSRLGQLPGCGPTHTRKGGTPPRCTTSWAQWVRWAAPTSSPVTPKSSWPTSRRWPWISCYHYSLPTMGSGEMAMSFIDIRCCLASACPARLGTAHSTRPTARRWSGCRAQICLQLRLQCTRWFDMAAALVLGARVLDEASGNVGQRWGAVAHINYSSIQPRHVYITTRRLLAPA